MTVTMIPKIAKSTGASVKCPNFTKVESLLIIIPELYNPTNVINKPIPAETASFI